MNAPAVTGKQESACLTDSTCSFSGLLEPHTTTGTSDAALLAHWEEAWNQVVEDERNRIRFGRHYDVAGSTRSRSRVELDTNPITWHGGVQGPSACSELSLVASGLSENWDEEWDGMGALAPSEALIQSVLELIECLRVEGRSPVTRASTTPSGTIILEWQGGGDYVEVEVVSPYRSEWMFVPHGRKPIHLTLGGEVQDG